MRLRATGNRREIARAAAAPARLYAGQLRPRPYLRVIVGGLARTPPRPTTPRVFLFKRLYFKISFGFLLPVNPFFLNDLFRFKNLSFNFAKIQNRFLPEKMFELIKLLILRIYILILSELFDYYIFRVEEVVFIPK